MTEPEDRKRKIDKAMEDLDLDQFFENAATPLDGLALAYKEAIETFERHEFSHKDALYLTTSMFTNNPGIAPG